MVSSQLEEIVNSSDTLMALSFTHIYNDHLQTYKSILPL
jgi:hypothetical protein